MASLFALNFLLISIVSFKEEKKDSIDSHCYVDQIEFLVQVCLFLSIFDYVENILNYFLSIFRRYQTIIEDF